MKLRAEVAIDPSSHRVPRAVLQEAQLWTYMALSDILLIHDVDRVPRLQFPLALAETRLHRRLLRERQSQRLRLIRDPPEPALRN